jgi:hypothetical protein
MQKTCPLPVYFGFDYLDQLLEKRKAGEPFVFMDHAYFERGYDKGNFRILLGKVHQTDITEWVPEDRMPACKDWKQGSKVYVIPIAPNLATWHDAHHWTTDTVAALKKHTDREIIVKPKNGIPLKDLLKDAWAVVSHSSVAAVEACQNGVPVFGPYESPAWCMGTHLEQIEKPVFPQRTNWLKTLSYSQFSIDEIRSGFAWATLKDIYGADYLRGT